jgi:hypothetical protein
MDMQAMEAMEVMDMVAMVVMDMAMDTTMTKSHIMIGKKLKRNNIFYNANDVLN